MHGKHWRDLNTKTARLSRLGRERLVEPAEPLHNLGMFLSTRYPAAVLTACALTGSLLAAESGSDRLAAPAAQEPRPPAAPVRIERFIDRVWIVEAGSAMPPGSVYVFLADNVLVIAPKGGSPVLGTWAEDVDGLVLTEKGRQTKVAVVEATPQKLRLRLTGGKTPTELTLAPAITPQPEPPPATTAAANDATPTPAAPPAPVSPGGAPYRCGADTFRVLFDGDKAYLTWPDNTVLVLRETRTADSQPTRRTYSDGEYRVVEDTSESFTRVLFARPGFRPRPCS